jgi:DNA-binding response OmpR family regulator
MGHILIVDDNEMNRDLLSRRLTRRDHQVSEAADGPTALALCEQHDFDMVLLDVMMPGMSGLEVLRVLRQRRAVSDLPVLMVTAKDQSQDMLSALELGANDYVSKPIDFPVLLARMRSHLDVRVMSRRLALLESAAREALQALAAQAQGPEAPLAAVALTLQQALGAPSASASR